MRELLQRVFKTDDAALRKFRELRAKASAFDKRIGELVQRFHDAEAKFTTLRTKFFESLDDADLAAARAAFRDAEELRHTCLELMRNSRRGEQRLGSGEDVRATILGALQAVHSRVSAEVNKLTEKQKNDLAALGLEGDESEHPGLVPLRRKLSQYKDAIDGLTNWTPDSYVGPWSFASLLNEI